MLRHPVSHFMALIIVGSIPVALMGFLLQDVFESLFSSLFAVSIALIITGILMFFSDRFNGDKSIKELTFTRALIVGIFQGLAITPGLSRSGSTIFGSLICGLKREEAAKFAFILSIPAILGAAGYQFMKVIGR